MNYVGNAGIFMIETVFGLYLLLVMLRFLLQWVRADFYNPISQGVVAITNPPLKILRRMIPGWFGIDFASLVLILLLAILKTYLIQWMIGRSPGITGVFVYSVGVVVQYLVWILIIAVIVRIVASWLVTTYNPLLGLLYSLTEPIMAPARRLIPPFGGIDFSPILVLVFLNLTRILIVDPLLHQGQSLMLMV